MRSGMKAHFTLVANAGYYTAQVLQMIRLAPLLKLQLRLGILSDGPLFLLKYLSR